MKHTFMCPVCGEVVDDIRDTSIPYEESRRPNAPFQKYQLRLVVCVPCSSQVQTLLTRAHAATGVGFHPLMLQCLRAAKINQETDQIGAAIAEFVRIINEHTTRH